MPGAATDLPRRPVPGAYPPAAADTVNQSNLGPTYCSPSSNCSNPPPYTSVIRASISDLERRILANASILVPDYQLTVVTAKQEIWMASKLRWFYTAAVVSPKNPKNKADGWLVEFKASVQLKGLTPGDVEEARGQAMEELLEEVERKTANKLFSRFGD